MAANKGRIAVLLLALICLSVLFSCGGKVDIDTDKFYLFENDYLTSEDIPENRSWTGISAVRRDKLLLLQSNEKSVETAGEKKEIHGDFQYLQVDLSTGKRKDIDIHLSLEKIIPDNFFETLSFSKVLLTPDGNLIQVCTALRNYIVEETKDSRGRVTSRKIMPTDNTKDYCLICIDDNGEPVWVCDLSGEYSDALTVAGNAILEYLVSDSGYIYIRGNQADEIVQISPDGKKVCVIQMPEVGASARLELDSEGRICIKDQTIYENGVSFSLWSLDDETGRFSGPTEYKVNTTGAVIPQLIFAPGHDIYLNMSGAVWYMDLPTEGEESAPVKLFEWLDVGLTTDMVAEFTLLGENSGVVVFRDSIDDSYHSAVLKKCGLDDYLAYYSEQNGIEATEELKSRKELQVVTCDSLYVEAVNCSGRRLLSYMQRFNRTNMQYKLNLERISGEESSVSGNLMRRMLSGDMPDVIAFAGKMRSRNFSRQDMFADLYSFMDRDEKHSREIFLPCVLETFEKSDGSLPILTTNFSVYTISAFSENAKGINNWSIDEMLDFADSLQSDRSFAQVSRKGSEPLNLTFLKNIMPALIGSFVDYENKTCDFESSGFRRFLQFCRDVRLTDKSAVMNGDAALMLSVINDPGTYMFSKKPEFMGREISFIGYPHGEGQSGTAIYPEMQFAIPKDSKNKDGGWAFLTTYIDCQRDELKKSYEGLPGTGIDIIQIPGFPCTWEAAELMLSFVGDLHSVETFIEYTDESSGERRQVGSSSFGWNYTQEFNSETKQYELKPSDSYKDPAELSRIAESRLKLYSYDADAVASAMYGELTKGDLESFYRIFEGKCIVWSDDSETLSIITEEAAAYFAGTRTLDEAVMMIQDRVTTRISE